MMDEFGCIGLSRWRANEKHFWDLCPYLSPYMKREVPALNVDKRRIQSTIQHTVESLPGGFRQVDLAEIDFTQTGDSINKNSVVEQVAQLQVKAKAALVRQLITQLETDQIQSILEFGLQEISDRHRKAATLSITHNTRLLLKKDYSYQDRGLSEPTQYYVYLRRRKPKLDRYIGTLFYLPQGCTLSYGLDEAGRILFNPPHNVFQLQDADHPEVIQVVRLLYLEPPPPDYTFDKQQNDAPEIRLHLEYLDSKTYQPIAKQAYPFPGCMYEGGKLDRYRWQVSIVTLPPDESLSRESTPPTSVAEPLPITNSVAATANFDLVSPRNGGLPEISNPFPPRSLSAPASAGSAEPSFHPAEPIAAQPNRRVLELPLSKSLTFYLGDRTDADSILKRMRLWATWSEKAIPQSRWEVVQDGTVYTLMNSHFKRRILKFSADSASVALENSLPVLMKWFHDLGLAVSQAQSQRQYTTAQLKLAHALFIDMSLPQNDPGIVLKKLFGVEFSKTQPDQ